MHEKLENNITLTFLFIVPEQKNTHHIVPCFQEHAGIDKNEFTFIMVRTTKNLEFKTQITHLLICTDYSLNIVIQRSSRLKKQTSLDFFFGFDKSPSGATWELQFTVSFQLCEMIRHMKKIVVHHAVQFWSTKLESFFGLQRLYFSQLVLYVLPCLLALLSALGQRNYTAKYSLSLVRNADYSILAVLVLVAKAE